MTTVLYFDGAAEPNPGGVGSWGFVIEGEGCRWDGAGHIPAPTTNNVAEWTALEQGLIAVLAHHPADLLIRGDSKLVVSQLVGAWACRAEHLQPFLARCRGLLAGLSYRAEWIPRGRNEDADRLSVSAWEAATGKPFPHRRAPS